MNIKSFTQLVSDQLTAIHARSSKLVDFSIGSILRSLAESNAGVAMWIQHLIVKLLVTTRAATCSGEDLDSWMADFGFFRHGATLAEGQVAFSRFTATTQAVINVGAEVKTQDGSQVYAVVPERGNTAFSAELNGYVIASGVSSILVPVKAIRAGAAGNVLAGMVTVISGSIPFVDTVINTSPMAAGQDEESDQAFRARFIQWIASLARGTRAAIEYAISTVPGCVSWTLTENQTPEGLTKPGYFYAVIDDGSDPSSNALIEKVHASIDAVRGFTITFGVLHPEVLKANISLRVETEAYANAGEIKSKVKLALHDYINRLQLGHILAYTQLVRVAYGASPLVVNVSELRLNNGIADMPATSRQVIRSGDITVS
ncbi:MULTISPECIES: baseplate J/gp47 family protein [unclassified Pantoea]|uniref:baseplate J/gp47 family protein n=1 Tax=unclassified Pantoea TaxID=2630326 RepID=UPI00301C1B72